MKIILIQSPCWTIHQPPLATAYLGSALRANGFEVKAYDLGIDLYNKVEEKYRFMFEMSNNSHWTYKFNETRNILNVDKFIDNWAKIILDEAPQVIGFSLYWTTSEISLLLAEKIKNIDSSKIIIFGGPSCLKEEKAFDFINRHYVDIVVVREGEETLLDIIRRIENRQDLIGIKGALIKKHGHVVDNGERDFIKNLDSISFPDFDDFDINSYAPFVSLPVLTSRGCIGRCTFCSEKNFWLTYRFRTADNIFEELKIQKGKYKENFYFVDSLINGNMAELSRLCDLIIDANLRVYWGGKARVDKRMSLEFLRKMKKAGCEALDYGIESGSQKIVNDMCKDIDLRTAEKVIRDTYKAGIRANCFFIIGYPSETFYEFLKTAFFVIRNRKFISMISSGSGCGIPPGSYLFKNRDELGILIGDGYSDWKTKDGRNTFDIRRKRLELFKKLAFLPGVRIEKNED